MSNFTWYIAVIFIVLFLILYLHSTNLKGKKKQENKINVESIDESLHNAL